MKVSEQLREALIKIGEDNKKDHPALVVAIYVFLGATQCNSEELLINHLTRFAMAQKKAINSASSLTKQRH